MQLCLGCSGHLALVSLAVCCCQVIKSLVVRVSIFVPFNGMCRARLTFFSSALSSFHSLEISLAFSGTEMPFMSELCWRSEKKNVHADFLPSTCRSSTMIAVCLGCALDLRVSFSFLFSALRALLAMRISSGV